MEKKLILRGLLAGAVGGLLAFVFARIFAEPLTDRAIAYQDAREGAQDSLDRTAGLIVPVQDGGALVGRTVQANLGLGVGMIAFGVAMGALFAVAYTLCLGRTGRVRPRPLALLVGAAGFTTVFLVPFLKYPTNSPGVSNPDTIADRTGLFLVMLAASVVTAVFATWAGQLLRVRVGTWNAALLAGGGFVAVLGVVAAVLPPLGHLGANVAATGTERATETPGPLVAPNGVIAFPGYPADVLAEYRLYSIGAQLILWTAIALAFAPLADRLLATGERPAVAPPREPAGV